MTKRDVDRFADKLNKAFIKFLKKHSPEQKLKESGKVYHTSDSFTLSGDEDLEEEEEVGQGEGEGGAEETEENVFPTPFGDSAGEEMKQTD